MEALTRLVAESLARHGFDRPLDYRRLHWSRWFRCDSHHSLLAVPSKPGVFAVAEEVMDFGPNVEQRPFRAMTDVKERFSATTVVEEQPLSPTTRVEERRFSAASGSHSNPALAAAGISPEAESWKPEAPQRRRMLAVTQFFEDDDMAFVLDRMLSRPNSMSARLASGRYFVRFVVIEDQTQRRSICSALNQWMVSASEKATGIGAHFATSLELTPATEYNPQADERQQSLFANEENLARTPSPATAVATDAHAATAAKPALSGVEGAVSRSEASRPVEERRFSAASSASQESAASAAEVHRVPAAVSPIPTTPHLHSGAATNIHCPSPFPSGF